MDAVIEKYGIHQEFEIALCHQVSEMLCKYYPNHPWMVGANHFAGTVHIQLAYMDKFGRMRKHGYLLHIKNLMDPNGLKQRAIKAGGEMLERMQMAREGAAKDAWQAAKSSTMILDGQILKSRHVV